MKTASRTIQIAVLYARVSSKDQEREGFSIPAQVKLLRQYAETHSLAILGEFTDVETAKQTGRSGFAEMLTFLKGDQACRTILVEKTDRLYRNFRDLITVDELGVTLHFVKEGSIVSPNSHSSDKFMHAIKVAMAKNYVDNLSEEVKKGLREKADQGHFPGVAHVGYVNNRVTRRIDVDSVRGPLVARVFGLYASGEYSLKALTVKAFEIGLRHWRGDRRMTKSEIHRMLQNPIYTGDFLWLGQRRQGSHESLVSRETFARVQAILHRKPSVRCQKQRHAFMGLLTCARCGCSMTAEKKKAKYVYYRCTGFKGVCGNTYIREERLADLLGDTIKPIQITSEIAAGIAEALRTGDARCEQRRSEARRQLEQRRRTVVSKLDRGYDDFVSGDISGDLWKRKSAEWEADLRAVETELARIERPRQAVMTTAERILELAQKAEFLYKSQDRTEQRRLLEIVLSNCTFDRGSVCPT
jgi:DNA invertase Pin-like site-specific DNA recombinase